MMMNLLSSYCDHKPFICPTITNTHTTNTMHPTTTIHNNPPPIPHPHPYHPHHHKHPLPGILIKTSDGGSSWTILLDTSNPASGTLAQVLGLAGGGSTAWSNSDGFKFHALSALSPAILYAGTTSGAIVRTVNGGFTWTMEKTAESNAVLGIYSLAMYKVG